MTLNISVVGAGAFGTALALSSLKTGARVSLLARRPEMAENLSQNRMNQPYLKDVRFPDTLIISSNPETLQEADLILLATPAQSMEDSIAWLKPFFKTTTPLVICAKGIHLVRQALLSGVVRPLVSNPLAILSGPSFAIEMAQNLPVAVMIAAETLERAIQISHQLRHDNFRCYATEDMVGVQIGGAVKNVIAIASGIVAGRKLGQSAQAALLSRGLAEITRIGVSLGARRETFMGLAGVGDLILTGSSMTSRNYSLGYEIGMGRSLDEILSERIGVTEGIATSSAVYLMGKKSIEGKIYTPIIDAVYHLLHNKLSLEKTINTLLSRQSDTEF